MANDLNTVFLIGRLTRDPEFKIVNNSSVVNFSLANNRVYVQNGAKKEETNYFDCVAWGKLADVIKQYTSKGKQVAIEGRLRQETWDTPDGKKASKVRIYVNNLQLLGASASPPSESSPSPPASDFSPEPTSYENIPEVEPEDIF